MSVKPLHLNIVRILSERDKTPVEMLAIKTGTTVTDLREVLKRLQQINVVKVAADQKTVSLTDPGEIPPMTKFYFLNKK